MSSEKNAEIWSTRLQKELLALTTENAPAKSQEVAEILPPFVKVKSHNLDIAEGRCEVFFTIDTLLFSPEEGSVALATKETDEESNADIEIIVDASLLRKPNGSIDTSASAYPFCQPIVILHSGAELFPEGSTIQIDNSIDIDCDWTPSLHLTDAILNIGLKVKESILQNEPFHPALSRTGSSRKDAVDDLVQGAKRLGSLMGKGVKVLVDKAPRRRSSRKKVTRKGNSPNEISIGDEISLLETPWVDCHGLYSCKAVRRPSFVEDAIFLALTAKENIAREELYEVNNPEGDDDDLPDDFSAFVKLQSGALTKVSGVAFAEAGALFSRFTQSAKSVLEESFLMITDTHIVEVKSSKLNLSTATVTFAISIELMAKLKFRRQESISLFFKPAPDDPLIFMCPDSAAAVHQIQTVLKSLGVKGKHTNAATQKTIHEALQVVQEIQAKERALEYQPSTQRVDEIMDLYRQSAELFEAAGDVRHQEVMIHMKKFLALPLTTSILDGSYKPEVKPKKPSNNEGAIPEGEVLERTKEQLEADDDEDSKMNEKVDDVFEQTIDTVLKEAKSDYEELNDGLEDLDGSGEDEQLSEFNAMLAAADKDLADKMADIMAS